MGKRGNGEGSIYPKKNKDGKTVGYRGSYWVYTAGGPKRRYISGRDRKTVAEKLSKALSDRSGGYVFDAGSMTVGDYLDRWLRDVKGTVRDSTWQRYEYAIRPHIKPTLGKVKLKDLTPAQLRWFYRDRLDADLAPATVHKLHVVIHKALAAATEDGLIPRNVAAGIKMAKSVSEEVSPLSSGEARRLLEAANGNRLEALYVLALSTGMRQGELLGLRWDDVNLEAGLLQVRRTLTKVGKIYTTGDPKTKKSRRVIRLTPRGVEALREHLSRQLLEIEDIGSLYKPGGYVFATNVGTLINPSHLRNRSFIPLLEAAKLRRVRFHDLRHTCATLLLSRNVNPKIVSEMLGHASVAITLDIYSHLMPDMQEKAVEALQEMLS